MATSLDQLKATGTVVVSDSGDFECEQLAIGVVGLSLLSAHSYIFGFG